RLKALCHKGLRTFSSKIAKMAKNITMKTVFHRKFDRKDEIKMKLFVVDVEKEDAIVHNIEFESGKYLNPSRLKGDYHTQAQQLLSLVSDQLPDKVVFNERAFGVVVKDQFKKLCQQKGYTYKDNGWLI